MLTNKNEQGISMESSVLSTVVLPLALFIIMLGLGLGLTKNDFKLVFSRPKAVFVGISSQMILLPIVAVALVSIFPMSPALAMGVIVLSLCPGGTTSNLFTYIARGDVALSVTLTAFVSVLAPFTIPIIFNLASVYIMGEGQAIALPVIKTIVQLCVITIVPICIGMIIRHWKPNFALRAEKPVRIFSVLFLMLIVLSLIIRNLDQLPGFIASVGTVTIMLNLICMAGGFGLAKLFVLEKRQAVSICLEVGLQNGTTALMITLTILENSTMAIGPTIYSLVMFFSGSAFAWWVTRAGKSKETNVAAS